MKESTRVASFWKRVNMNGPVPQVRWELGRCWIWTANKDPQGYGVRLGPFIASGKRKYYKAHRYAYELLVAPIPEGFVIDHLCCNHSCVNPKHMETVTIKENVMRGNGLAALNARKTECKRGHELSGDNLSATEHRYDRRECRLCINERQRGYRRKRKEVQNGIRQKTSATRDARHSNASQNF